MTHNGNNILICGKPLEDCLQKIERFHNWKAPGLVLGLFMVDWALEQIGPDIETDAIVESRYCLPDAIQLFTPCTIGNGWLKIVDWEKFALSLYDRRKLNGYRVWLDLDKTSHYPDLYNWYMRLVPKKDLPLKVLLEVIISAKRSVLSSRKIHMTRYYKRVKKGDIAICSECKEAYPVSQGSQCAACQGDTYFEYQA
jgi:formylmethanofuran dehydrogenase subunit E